MDISEEEAVKVFQKMVDETEDLNALVGKQAYYKFIELCATKLAMDTFHKMMGGSLVTAPGGMPGQGPPGPGQGRTGLGGRPA